MRVAPCAHDEGRPLRQFDRKMLERSRNQQIFRFHRDRLTVGIHLIQEELDRFLQTVCRQSTGRAREQVFVIRAEQRLAVRLRRIREKPAEKQLIDQSP